MIACRRRSTPILNIFTADFFDYMNAVMQVEALSRAGYKEITLLGQNVNSYRYTPTADDGTGVKQQQQQEKQQQQQQQPPPPQQQQGVMSKGFSTIYKPPPSALYDFADLVHAGPPSHFKIEPQNCCICDFCLCPSS